MIFDYCVIGGGIVGLATAMKLLEMQPNVSVILLEKEAGLARHQTGHNSGVIHAGLYYEPGSLKANFCRRGAKATKAFCDTHAIPYKTCGKLVVATNALELSRMEGLRTRAIANQIEVRAIGAAELHDLEPNIRGLGALLVPETGIVDYVRICERMAELIEQQGTVIEFNVTVTAIQECRDHVAIESNERRWQARKLIACAGLQSDRVAKLAGIKTTHQIIPFRGEYYRLPSEKNEVVNHLIYPIGAPDLPFLGVHLTRMIDGSVTVGPNAVLGFSREGYEKFSFDFRDVVEYLSFPGFWKTMGGNLGHGFAEMQNSIFKARYLQACRKYCPSLRMEDLLPCESGIRAQAVAHDGTLLHDFLFLETARMLHVCNAPSPAATSAMPIGSMIARKVMQH